MPDPTPQERDIVPAEYGGKWIAWDDDQIHIVASAESDLEAERIAIEAGVKNPFVELVPPADGGYVGTI